MVFKGFLPKFQKKKNPGFFWNFVEFQKKNKVFKVFYQNVKKTLGFPKFQKFQDEAYLPKKIWNFGILENSRFFWNCKGIGKKEVGITFSFYWQCLNRTKTVKTGGFLQFSNTCTRKHVKNTVVLNVFECST